MKDYRDIVLTPSASIIRAIEIIDKGAVQIALVVDESNRLLGTITDGDIRRGILKGLTLDDPVKLIMNPNPVVVGEKYNREQVINTMRSRKLHQIPVVDKYGKLLGIEILDELITIQRKDNWVVLMAGGLGTRLRPLTDNCPKPLLNVGDKPVLETILENFIEQGFFQFFISVNYKAEMIKNYFQDGSRWGVSIEYLHEDRPLGTVGALGLLPRLPQSPVIVMNGDILTKVDFNSLLNFHEEHQVYATMCVREYRLQIPYGVVKVDNYRLSSIEEKPVKRFFINAGLYVLNPTVLKYIQPNRYLDMPQLFKKLLRQQKETAIFPIREYWMDIGRIDDYEKANGEYPEVFG